MGASLTSAQTRRRFARMGNFARCGIAKTPFFEKQHAAQIIYAPIMQESGEKYNPHKNFQKNF
ncbi:MAG: hypothetical protein J6P20_00770 [Oscillospiraceae bacterium]|nr:hypothetical protein [Oscillospiraceae bacterium]